MAMSDAGWLRSLVGDDRVHRAVYRHPRASHESTVATSGRQFRCGDRGAGGAELPTDKSVNPGRLFQE
jgi:hypothetical protein